MSKPPDMKLKTILMHSILAFSAACAHAQNDTETTRSAPSFILQNAQDGSVIRQFNADAQRPVASLTKLITAIAVLQANPSLACQTAIEPQDVDAIKNSSSRLPVGTKLSCPDLLRLMLANSENRAANALARAAFPAPEAFYAQTRSVLSSLGISAQTYDPAGLDPRNAFSAKQMLAVLKKANEFQLIKEASTLQTVDVQLPGNKTRSYKNTNKLIRDSKIQASLSKTGYISESGRNIALSAAAGRTPVHLVILGAPDTKTRDAWVLRALGGNPPSF